MTMLKAFGFALLTAASDYGDRTVTIGQSGNAYGWIYISAGSIDDTNVGGETLHDIFVLAITFFGATTYYVYIRFETDTSASAPFSTALFVTSNKTFSSSTANVVYDSGNDYTTYTWSGNNTSDAFSVWSEWSSNVGNDRTVTFSA